MLQAAAMKPSSSPGRTSSPLPQSSTYSAAAAMSKATTGSPDASASSVTLPKVSLIDGKRNRSADA